MNLKRQKTSIKNRKYTGGKKDTTYFTKKLNEFGLKVPKYLGNGNITQKQFNSLSGIKKELVIKQALNKIKEKYENSDNPADYKFKAYNQVMNNLINYGKNDEVS